MKTKNHRITTRHCAHCGQRFIVEPRLGKRHRFCSDLVCKEVCHRASRKKWLREHGGNAYFKGEHTLERVREWRHRHPEYWKRKRQNKHSWRVDFMLSKELILTVRDIALQESIDTDFTLKIVAISRFSNVALQESIAKKPRLLIMRGHVTLRGKKNREAK